MGVFKWLRRERVTVTTHSLTSDVIPEQSHSETQIGTIRTEEYKRDLAEFQARRSIGAKESPAPPDTPALPDTPVKKKCSRNSLPVSCTDCASAHDNTFSYEKKSAAKYKKKTHKRARSAAADERIYEALPNIQFLFQNQVFMPGNLCPTYSEPHKLRRSHRHRSPEFIEQRHIDFSEEKLASPSLFLKNNSLPFDVLNFLENTKSEEEVDGHVDSNYEQVKPYCRSSLDEVNKPEKEDDHSDEKLWEVMSELRNFDQWADEQLQTQTYSKSDDSNKSDDTIFGLPVASASNIDIEETKQGLWSQGTWGVVPVQVKKVHGVSIRQIQKKINVEIDILRKCRHPNIILLMGLYPDVQNNVNIICEQCVDSLYGIIHIQGRILSAQSAMHYTQDVSSALVFLRMQGYIHTALTSHSIMITTHDAAKLADLGPCVKLPKEKRMRPKEYDLYSPEPQYVNIEETQESSTAESEPLISKRSSETYLASNSVPKEYKHYKESEYFRWQAPELFESDEEGLVHPCTKSTVYSLCVILWEACNASVPWKTLSYAKLKELYTLWKTGFRLPQDGTYPGGLLALLQSGLTLSRVERLDLATLHSLLRDVKEKLDDMEYIVIPARISKKKSNFSSVGWGRNTPTDESDCLSPLRDLNSHSAVVHKNNSTDSSEKESKSDTSPSYEIIRNDKCDYRNSNKCYNSDEDNIEERPMIRYEHLPEKDISSACSTPIAKLRARIKDIGTPGGLHRSDSTEYCSILSPDNRHFSINDEYKDDSMEKPSTKLTRSFTPQSYKPLHIKVPEFNLESVKSIIKENGVNEKATCKFDIKNYSLPTTPIARSNKLRRNAWLSGDIAVSENVKIINTPSKEEPKLIRSAPETPYSTVNNSSERDHQSENGSLGRVQETSPSDCLDRDSFTGLRRVDRPQDFSPSTDNTRGTGTWSAKSSLDRPKQQLEEDVLAKVNVKPLVAIHERWIYEANRKTGRSMSLPDDNRSQVTAAVKPASHCVDTLLKSLPQLNLKRPAKPFRTHPVSPVSNCGNWEQFCQARENVAKSINFTARDPDKVQLHRADTDKGTETEPKEPISKQLTDRATDTRSIEEFIRDLIRKEFTHLIHEISDDTSTVTTRNEDILNRGVANIVENLKNGDDRKEVKSFSRVKINGNNKPLLQITFSRTGENSLHVLDNCVNVTICDNASNCSGRDKLNTSMEDTLMPDDVQVHSLKRCQAFNAIQEARSTEDLYIDDDLSTQMQENFGGKVKLIPLHGSLHEIMCEREDECCLLKVKQENGCDTIYFRCDNSDTESRDAIDGCSQENKSQDTVIYKRSISLVEERIKRIFPKEKRTTTPTVRRSNRNVPNLKIRPKSEVFPKAIDDQTRLLSRSSPSLIMKDKIDEVEVNIDSMYQDSSSEECIQCKADKADTDDDFELLEQKIEEDIAMSKNLSDPSRLILSKISEENLADDVVERLEIN